MMDLAAVVWSIAVAMLVYGAGRVVTPDVAALAPVVIEVRHVMPRRRRVER